MDLGEDSSTSCSNLPVREISSEADLDQFQESEAFAKFYGFIQIMGKAVEGKSAKDFSIPSNSAPYLRYARLLLNLHIESGMGCEAAGLYAWIGKGTSSSKDQFPIRKSSLSFLAG